MTHSLNNESRPCSISYRSSRAPSDSTCSNSPFSCSGYSPERNCEVPRIEDSILSGSPPRGLINNSLGYNNFNYFRSKKEKIKNMGNVEGKSTITGVRKVLRQVSCWFRDRNAVEPPDQLPIRLILRRVADHIFFLLFLSTTVNHYIFDFIILHASMQRTDDGRRNFESCCHPISLCKSLIDIDNRPAKIFLYFQFKLKLIVSRKKSPL